jgi:hypothetical protein
MPLQETPGEPEGHLIRYGRGDYWRRAFWLFVHLLYLMSFQSRVLVATQWAFLYFTFNRSARLILGERRERMPL